MRSLLHLSDLHFGALDQTLLPPLLGAIERLRPDLIAISGDFTQRARRAQFLQARAFLDQLRFPTVVVPGNHDVPLFDLARRFLDPLERYRRFISDDLTPVVADREFVVVGLNSTRSMLFKHGSGRLNESQVRAAAARLRLAPPGAIRIVVTHHPFDVPDGHGEQHLIGRAGMAMERLAAAGADLFLSGHLHVSHVGRTAERYKIAGHSALVVQAGTLSRRGRGELNSFNLLRLEASAIAIERFSWSTTARDFTPAWAGAFERAADGWHESGVTEAMIRYNVTRRRWRSQRVMRRWRYRLAPDPRHAKPKATPHFGTRLRRLFWSWWPWAIVSIVSIADHDWSAAVATGAMSLISFLIAPSESPPRYGLDHSFSISDEEFVPTMSGATGHAATDGNRITVLNNGDEFYPSMLQAIHDAEISITIEAYIYWSGDIGRTTAKALADASRDGVVVKVLLDAVGSATIGEDILRILEGGKCQLAWYNPVRWYSLNRLNHRTHRKSLILDGRIAFTGGAGIADQWLGHAEGPGHWRDIQIKIEGPAVRPLQTGFAKNWLQATGELIAGEPFYPVIPQVGDLTAYTIVSSPEAGASTVRTMYYLSIVCARKTIYIANPYFVPDEVAMAALIDAKARGVDVQIMVSGIHNDAWLARRNSTRLYGKLLDCGVVILEYNHTMLHQKTMVVDGVWATVGTTNFDSRSFAHNEENNVCVYDADWACALHNVFLDDAKVCEQIDPIAWKRRGASIKAQEFLAAFLKDQV